MKWKEVKVPLREFYEDGYTHQLSNVTTALSAKLGKFQRVGGTYRIYDIEDTDQKGVIYVVGNSLSALGFGFSKDEKIVKTIYLWHNFSVNNEPNYMIDLPDEGDFELMVPAIVQMLRNQTMGPVPAMSSLAESKKKLSEARRTNEAEFIQMARQMYGDKSSNLTWPEIMAVGTQNDVQVPGTIRHNRDLKVDTHHWNLSGGQGADDEKTKQAMASELGGEIDAPEQTDPNFQTTLQLAKVRSLQTAAAKGVLYLMGKGAKGKFFKIPGIEALLAQLERMLSRQLAASNPNPNGSMEDQYELLEDKVKLIAGGQSQFIKSLLITGAPSSGKTYHVMQVIKGLGLVEGEDYIVKKGRITVPSMYRVLIEQINGLVIFDDCDSVVEDKNGINMLKGALDTDPVREISYDARGTINTAVMRPVMRDEYTDRLSRILRGTVEEDDAAFFAPYAKIKKGGRKKETAPERSWDEMDGEDDSYEEVDDSESAQIIEYVTAPNHLPNKIDFKGRIIFISNMEQDDWDSAIITRATTQNLSFMSEEMLDYIDKVKGNIKTPGLTDEQKQEVMDFIREQWTLGTIKAAINFRLVQQAFDLRLTTNWQKLIKML